MPKNDKFDPRLESLVVETATRWEPESAELSEEEKRRVANELHRQPQTASKIFYRLVHTGMIREITVTSEDLQRLRPVTQEEASEPETQTTEETSVSEDSAETGNAAAAETGTEPQEPESSSTTTQETQARSDSSSGENASSE